MTTDQPRGCTNFKLRQLLRRVSLVYDHAMAECGLKITQYSLLTHVDRLGPITQADLARAMAMDSSTLSRNLKPLQTAGWVSVRAGDDAHKATWVPIADIEPETMFEDHYFILRHFLGRGA